MNAPPEQAWRLSDFKALPWQAQLRADVLYREPRTLVGIEGGSGSGKSAALVQLGAMLCRTRRRVDGGPYEAAVAMDSHARLRRIHKPLADATLQGMATLIKSESRYVFHATGASLHLVYFEPAGNDSIEGTNLEGLNLCAVLLDECQALPAQRALKVASRRARIASQEIASGRIFPGQVVAAGLPGYDRYWMADIRRAGEAGEPVSLHRPVTADNLRNLEAGVLEKAQRVYTPDEYARLFEGKALPPSGTVFDTFKPTAYAEGGNLLPASTWTPTRETRCFWAMDFGRRSPVALLIAEVAALDAYVVFAEVAPNKSTVEDLAADMLRVAWPRALSGMAPGHVPYIFDAAVGDPAGDHLNPQTDRSDIDVLRRAPPTGIGAQVQIETSSARRSILDGVLNVRRAFAHRRLLVWAPLWEQGRQLRAKPEARTLYRSILGYSWQTDGNDMPIVEKAPVKDEVNDHHADALRYFVRDPRFRLWSDARPSFGGGGGGVSMPTPELRAGRAGSGTRWSKGG